MEVSMTQMKQQSLALWILMMLTILAPWALE